MSILTPNSAGAELKVRKNDKSSFSVRSLRKLGDPATSHTLPLAVIALIDLNAFFAQVEQIRLNLTIDDPVVCVQWSSLIAVSYEARKYGIGRMDTVQSAQEKCPNIILAHAAVFKKGEGHWSYVPGLPDPGIHKVLLDPYRRESRKIIKIIKEFCDDVQKASVDECYINFSSMVLTRVLELFPDLRKVIASSDVNEKLPLIPDDLPDSLQFHGQIFTENSVSSPHNEIKIKDWDDICLVIGSQLLFHLRKQIYEKLGYTTSGGISRNKMVAKLAAGYKKPDNQTIILNHKMDKFLDTFELTDLTGMGGKIGDLAIQKLGVPPGEKSIRYIRNNFDQRDLEKCFPNDTNFAAKVFQLVRGNFSQELSSYTEVKSMMSRKNFVQKYPVKTLQDACDWIKVFAGDLINRIIEVDDEHMNILTHNDTSKAKPSLRRPKTISVQITTTSYSKHSKQTLIPVMRSLEKLGKSIENTSYQLFFNLVGETPIVTKSNGGQTLKQIFKDPNTKYSDISIMSLANISLGLSNFVDCKDSHLIDSYTDVSKQTTAAEAANHMFEELKREQTPDTKESLATLDKKPSPKQIKPEVSDYIKKMFQDFNSKQTSPETQALQTHPGVVRPKIKTPINKAEKLFQTSPLEVQKLSSKNDHGSTNQTTEGSADFATNDKKKNMYNILDNLKAPHTPKNNQSVSESTHHPTDTAADVASSNFCSKCNQVIQNDLEHKDFHIALELSQKLGNPVHGINAFSTNSNSKKRKLNKRQAQLPF